MKHFEGIISVRSKVQSLSFVAWNAVRPVASNLEPMSVESCMVFIKWEEEALPKR